MGILLVYDVTDEQSFQNIRTWIRNIEQHAAQNVDKVLIGNKCDMEADKQVDTGRAQRLADEYGVQLFEASAKNNINVTEAFTHIAKDIKRRLMDSAQGSVAANENHVDVDSSEKPKKRLLLSFLSIHLQDCCCCIRLNFEQFFERDLGFSFNSSSSNESITTTQIDQL